MMHFLRWPKTEENKLIYNKLDANDELTPDRLNYKQKR